MEADVLKKINDIEEELKKIKEALGLETARRAETILDLFGSWEGEVDSFLNELYSRRKRKGRLISERLPL